MYLSPLYRACWACFIGYGFPIILGWVYIGAISKELWRATVSDQKQKLHLWYSRATGVLEQVMYVTAFLIGHGEFIGVWLAFKVVGRWQRSEKEFNDLYWEPDGKLKTQAILNNFLIGNVFSIILAVLGFKWFGWIKCEHEEEFIVTFTAIVIFFIVFHIFVRKHSDEVRKELNVT